MQVEAAWPKPVVWVRQAECHVKKECGNLKTGAVLDLFAKS